MQRKRVLITGAAGFLGSHLCDRFIKEDYQVIGMDNLITGDLNNIKHLFKLGYGKDATLQPVALPIDGAFQLNDSESNASATDPRLPGAVAAVWSRP